MYAMRLTWTVFFFFVKVYNCVFKDEIEFSCINVSELNSKAYARERGIPNPLPKKKKKNYIWQSKKIGVMPKCKRTKKVIELSIIWEREREREIERERKRK